METEMHAAKEIQIRVGAFISMFYYRFNSGNATEVDFIKS